MGFELLTQPQVFTTRLTAVGGIEGYVPPFISKFHTWVINTTTPGSVFDIPQDFVGLTHATDSAFIVNINGSIKAPDEFDINVDFRKITFYEIIPSNTKISITQIGTVEMLTASFVELTGLDFFSLDSRILNLSSNNIVANDATISDLVVGQVTGPLNVVGPITTEKITVNANTSDNAVRITQQGTGDYFLARNTSNPSNIPFVIKNTGRVGIGTTSPGEALQVAGNLRVGNGDSSFIAFRGTTGDGPGTFNHSYIGERVYDLPAERSELLIYKGNDSATQAGPDRIRLTAPALIFQTYPTALNTAGDFEAVATNPSTDNTRLIINPDGKVGIGTVEPEALLHVHGTVSDILQTATGSDSPVLIQRLTDSYVDASCGIEIVERVNPYIPPGGNSHALYFNRDLPLRPVHYWYTSTPSPTSIFSLPGGSQLTQVSQNYIVAVGGLVQPSTSYTVASAARTITFTQNVPANVSVYILQLVNPQLAAGYDITAATQVNATITPTITSVSLVGLGTPYPSPQFQYLVSVDGIYQIPTNVSPIYSINTGTGVLNFNVTIPRSMLATVTRLPSANPNSAEWSDACFVGQLFNWSFVTSAPTTVYQFGATPENLLAEPELYLVNIGGVLQAPFSYSVNADLRTITFNDPIPAGVSVSITQLAQPQLPVVYSTTVELVGDCTSNTSGLTRRVGEFRPGQLLVQGGISTSTPIFIPGTSQTYNVPFSASSIIFSGTTGGCVITLPRPLRCPGRWICIKTLGESVNSSSSDILSFTNVATNTIMVSGAARWVHLQSTGTNWVIMTQGNAD